MPGPALAQPPKLPPVTIGEPPWMKFARAEYLAGVREVPGPGSNPRVEEYLRTCGIHATDETAWCSAFVNWCVTQAALKGTARGAARSWATWGVPAAEPPPFGAIVTLWRETPKSAKGHVGFLVRVDGPQIWLLGGNQGNAVSIHAFPAFRVLAYRVMRQA